MKTRGFEVQLPGLPPTANNLFRAGRHGRGRYKTRQYRDWLTETEARFLLAGRNLSAGKPWSLCVSVRGLKRTRDLDNCLKPFVDALVRTGLVPDDRWLDRIVMVREIGPTGAPKDDEESVSVIFWEGSHA